MLSATAWLNMKQRNHRRIKSIKSNRRKTLQEAGWKVGPAKEFLGLSDEEAAFVELKLTFSASPKKCRTSQGLSQSESANVFAPANRAGPRWKPAILQSALIC
jgi:hypothetical protein